MQLFDTHCHIHEALEGAALSTETWKRFEKAGSPKPDAIIEAAAEADVTRLVCVGTTVEDSALAVDFVQSRPQTWATIGIHPHEAKEYVGNQIKLDQFAALAKRSKVVGVGECGLDYYYTHSQPKDQAAIVRFQIELALEHDLPMVFHVRDAFGEFWPIFDSYKGIRGVIHSFSATRKDLEQILQRGLYVGLNGIMTFTKDEEQLAAARAVPLDKMVLETDAPFLTPAPYRGTMCEPKHVRVTAEFLANLREESIEELADRTTANALNLFGL
jgi:TatD DNase family protein